MNSTNQNINPKLCSYDCNTRIYWNTSENAYFEVFSNKKYVCPTRSNKTRTTNNNTSSNANNRPFYRKKVELIKQKMSNSLELLQGPIADVQKKYEILSDIVSEANGKVHGSQSHIIVNNNANSISLIVYYEVPDGQRDEIKHKFNSFVKNSIVYNSHQQ